MNPEMPDTETVEPSTHDLLPPETRILGRTGRLLLGAFLIAVVVSVYLKTDWNFWGVALAIAGGAVVFYAIVHMFILKFFGRINRWLGALLAVSPVGLAFVLGNAQWQVGVMTFVGISLILDAIRRDSGCEVMAIPGLLLGQRTHLVCIVFSPIDWAERRLARNRS